jgi:hypothetical protein
VLGALALISLQIAIPSGLTVGAAASTSAANTLEFTGKAVNFDLSGLEPDFDPIYKLAISGTLHDGRQGDHLPDATLILSAYLEVFQPDTTPVLPDLLHTDQVATDLAGFLSGKAALVNRGGRVVYQGSLLAEIFQGNGEHLIVDLSRLPSGSTVRLQGAIMLAQGGGEHGTLQALSPLARQALAVPVGRASSWQQVIGSMSVHKPVMMGTAAPPGARPPAQPSTIAPASLTAVHLAVQSCDVLCRVRRPITLVPLGLGALLACAGATLGLSRRARGNRSDRPTEPPPSVA